LLTSLKDSEGKIIAYAEWRLVGPSGLETPAGKYVWINDCWVHKDYRGKHRINLLIDEVMRHVPNAEYCYFQRKDVNEKLHMYSRRQWERRRMSHDPLITGEK